MHPPPREQLVPNRVRPAGPHGNNRVAQNVQFMSIGAPAGRPIPMIALHGAAQRGGVLGRSASTTCAALGSRSVGQPQWSKIPPRLLLLPQTTNTPVPSSRLSAVASHPTNPLLSRSAEKWNENTP